MIAVRGDTDALAMVALMRLWHHVYVRARSRGDAEYAAMAAQEWNRAKATVLLLIDSPP